MSVEYRQIWICDECKKEISIDVCSKRMDLSDSETYFPKKSFRLSQMHGNGGREKPLDFCNQTCLFNYVTNETAKQAFGSDPDVKDSVEEDIPF